MSKFTIYSKDGVVRHESVTEYNSDGEQVWTDSLEYNGSWMGECFLTVTVKSAYPIDFHVGDYIDYRGERFTINYDPSVVKKARRGTHGEGFVYDSIKFNAYQTELTDVRMLDCVLSDNNLHYTSLPTFTFHAAKVDDLLDRLQANTNRWCQENGMAVSDYWIWLSPSYTRTGNRCEDVTGLKAVAQARWKSIFGNDTTEPTSYGDDEKRDVLVSINNQNAWDAAALIKNDFGLNFIVRNRSVIVASAGVPTTNIFQYGKDNGLYEIERQADTEQQIITKLFAYGSGKNLPIRYYANIDAQCYATVTVSGIYHLIDIPFSIASQCFLLSESSLFYLATVLEDGEEVRIVVTDVPEELREQYGGTHSWVAFGTVSSYNTGDRMYFGGINIDKWPASHRESSLIPNNMAVNNLMLPGFPKKSLYQWVLDDGGTAIADDANDSRIGKASWSDGTTTYTAFFSKDTYEPFIMSPNFKELGVREAVQVFDGSDELDEIYPTIEGTGYDEIEAADVITDNGVFGETEPSTFKITLPDFGSDFKLNEQVALGTQEGGTPTISMRDGFCGSCEFEIQDAVQNETTHKWEVTVKRYHNTLIDLWFPYSYAVSQGSSASANEPYQVKADDHYVLTGIPMTDTYIAANAKKLLAAALDLLAKNDYTRYTYLPKVDEIFMARQHDDAVANQTRSLYLTLKEGDLLRFSDSDLGISTSQIFIDTLRITENGNADIPTYDVTLRNDKQVGTIQRIQNKIDSISGGVASGIIGGVNRSEAIDIVSSEGNKRFLSKIKDDTAQGLIGFVKGLWVKAKGLFGIDGNGNATLNSVTSDDIHSNGYNDDNIGGSGYHIYKDANSEGHVCTDYLDVRKKARFTELEIRRLSYINADQVQSMAASKVEKVLPIAADGTVISSDDTTTTVVAYRCLAVADDGSTATKNGWALGDQARCQTFNISTPGNYQNVENRFYWRLVVRVGQCYDNGTIYPSQEEHDGKVYHFFDLANIMDVTADAGDEFDDFFADGHATEDVYEGYMITLVNNERTNLNDIPATEDAVVQMGNRIDTDRMGFFITKADNLNTGPYIYAGVNQFSLVDKMITKITPAEVLISARKLKVFSDPNAGDASPLTHYRGDWTDGSTSYYYDEWDYNGSRWLCLYQGAEGITCAPGEMPSNAPQGATVADYWKEISLKGDSDVTVYTRGATQPPAPIDSSIPPNGWSTDPTKAIYGVIPGNSIDDNFVRHTIHFTTTQAAETITVLFIASSEANYDFIICGEIDESVTARPAGIGGVSDAAKAVQEQYHAVSGRNSKMFYLQAGQAGEHTLDVCFTKDGSDEDDEDCGYYWITGANFGSEQLPIWASKATFNGDTKISGWSTPVRWNGQDGEPGTIYNILPSPDKIAFGYSNGVLSPDKVYLSCSVNKITGGSTENIQSGQFGSKNLTLRYSARTMPSANNEGTEWGTSDNDITFGSYQIAQIPNSFGLSSIFLALFDSNGTLLDRETIPVIKDGQNGNPGADAWTLTVNPSPIIIEQDIETPSSFGLPINISFIAKCGDNTATVGTIGSGDVSNNLGLTISRVTTGTDYNNGVRLQITGYNKNSQTGRYATNGYIACTIPLSYGSGTTARSTSMAVRIQVGVNLLGTWTTEIKDGVETSVSEKLTNAIVNGETNTFEQVGTYVRGWAENTARLTETVSNNSIANDKNLFGFTRNISYDGAVPFVQGYGFVATYNNSQQYGRIYNIKLNDGAGYYVVSCEIKAQSEANIRFFLADIPPEKGSGLIKVGNELKVAVTTQWKKIVAVYNLTAADVANSNGQLVIRDGSTSNYVFIRHLQIERGSTPSLFGICADDAANNSEPMHVTWNQSPSGGMFSDETSGNYGPGGTSNYTTNNVYPSSNPQYPQNTGYIELIKGDLVMSAGVYTLSFWARASVNESVMECFCYDATDTQTFIGALPIVDALGVNYGELDPDQTEGMNLWGSTNIRLTTAWKKYYVHWYLTGASSKISVIPIRINGSHTGGSHIDYYIAQIKLERGYVASSNRTVYETVMKQTARRMDFSVLVNSMEKAGIHLYTSNNTTPESEDEIDEGVIDLVAGKVNFKAPNGTDTNPKISIDPITATLKAVDGEFSGKVTATSGSFSGTLEVPADGGTFSYADGTSFGLYMNSSSTFTSSKSDYLSNGTTRGAVLRIKQWYVSETYRSIFCDGEVEIQGVTQLLKTNRTKIGGQAVTEDALIVEGITDKGRLSVDGVFSANGDMILGTAILKTGISVTLDSCSKGKIVFCTRPTTISWSSGITVLDSAGNQKTSPWNSDGHSRIFVAYDTNCWREFYCGG